MPLAALAVSYPMFAATQKDVTRRIDQAATVVTEIMDAPDKGIPDQLLDKAHCIAIIPGVKKGAFIVGGEYGKGVISCRLGNGQWSAPGNVRLEGGSVGFQIGGSETDLVLLVMNKSGEDKLLSSQFTLGGEASAAAGPIGRTVDAQTDAHMAAEILAWSRARGVFAGISLKGATLRQDLDDNEALYGRRIENRDIVNMKTAWPPAAARFQAFLRKHSPVEQGSQADRKK